MAETVQNPQRRGRLAWFLFALSVALMGVLVALDLAGCGYLYNPSDPRPAVAYGLFLIPADALAFSFMGALVISRRPDNNYGWLMLLFGLGMNLQMIPASYSTCAISGQLDLPFGAEVLAFGEVLAGLVFLAPFYLLLVLYPDGRFLSPRWRRWSIILIAAFVLLLLPMPFRPGQIGGAIEMFPTAENPLGLAALDIPGLMNMILIGYSLISTAFILLGTGSLIVRYRSSRAETRQQIKWFLFFAATVGALFIAVDIAGLTIAPQIFQGWFYFLVLTLFWIGLPVIIGLAILKYRLFDIDIIIRRTLVYGLLTAVLIAVYFGVVLLAQSAFVSLTGQESPLAIVISTLVIAALFNPLRRRIQAFIDRRFYRRSYDPARTLAQFAQTARDEVEIEQLAALLMGTVDETMQPETAVLWLAKSELRGRREISTLGASDG